MTQKTNSPYVHLELLSQTGETGKKGVGSKPFVLILTAAYQTDGITAETIKANLLHSAQVLNGTVAKDKVRYPYTAYPEDTGFGGVNRNSSWCYVSMRNIPEKVEEIKAWLLKIATELTIAQGLKLEKMKVEEGGTTATLSKIAWLASELVKTNVPT